MKNVLVPINLCLTKHLNVNLGCFLGLPHIELEKRERIQRRINIALFLETEDQD